KDWRKVDPRSPIVKRSDQPAPAGEWGTATAASTVSRQALLEAEALPAKKAPVSKLRWAVRGLVGTAAGLLVGLGGWGFLRYQDANRQQKALDLALQFLKGAEGKPQLGDAASAQINQMAGEFFLRANQVEKARKHCTEARAQANGPNVPPSERDFLMMELA